MIISKVYCRNCCRLMASAICFLAISGCVNFDDVTQLSKTADGAQQALSAVIADIPASCARQNVLLGDIPAAEKPASLTAQDCKPYQDVANHLAKDNAALISYFDALGKLASNTPPAYDQSIDTNVAAIGKLPNLSQDAVDASTAAQSLMKVLADSLTTGYRAKEIKSIVTNADPHVQKLTADLKQVITVDYMGILSSEGVIQDTFYQSPLAAAKPSERLSLVLVQRQYEGDQTALQSKVTAATAYGKVMDSLASLHAKLLMATKKRASVKEIAKDLGPEIGNLKSSITQLQTELK